MNKIAVGLVVALIGGTAAVTMFKGKGDANAELVETSPGSEVNSGDGTPKAAQPHVEKEDEPRPGAEADTVAASIKAFAAANSSTQARVERLEASLSRIEKSLAELAESEPSDESGTNAASSAITATLDALRRDVESIKENAGQLNAGGQDIGALGVMADELPVGMGGRKPVAEPEIDVGVSDTAGATRRPKLVSPGDDSAAIAPPALAGNMGELEWIAPLDASQKKGESGEIEVVLPEFSGSMPSLVTNIYDATVREQEKLTGANDEEGVPAYTIPMNGTGLDSVTMTALIGRVPVGGSVVAPYPFKLVLGPEILASNGISVPAELTGIVLAGYATGDMTLVCAKADITSATFTFSDGTIHSVGNNMAGGEESIGYLSDAFGVPCISGEYISNLPSHIAQTGGLAALGAAADAYAAAQTTTTTGSDGTSTSTVTGSKGSYAAGQAGTAAINSTVDLLNERLQGAFDAVYVEPGRPVAVHFSQQIQIDYHPKGRKVNHYADITSGAGVARTLD